MNCVTSTLLGQTKLTTKVTRHVVVYYGSFEKKTLMKIIVDLKPLDYHVGSFSNTDKVVEGIFVLNCLIKCGGIFYQ